MPGSGLWIFVLESALALALLVFIVWWTLPRKRHTDSKDSGDSSVSRRE